jgi:hypothetical protein
VCEREREKEITMGFKQKRIHVCTVEKLFLLSNDACWIFSLFCFQPRSELCAISGGKGTAGKIRARRACFFSSPFPDRMNKISHLLELTHFLSSEITCTSLTHPMTSRRETLLFLFLFLRLVRLSCHFSSLLLYLNNVILMIYKHRL